MGKITKDESLLWWYKTIRKWRPGRKPEDYTAMKRRRIAPGALLTYKYQAKGASKLPFWDKQPLVIIFRETSRHFVGINLHYIHPKFRPLVLSKIIRINRLKIKNNRKFTLEYKQLRVWMIQNHLTLSIRKYIKGRMSKVIYIPGEEWKYAASVPSERFVFNGSMDRDKLYKLIALTGGRRG